jgi:hypothetical protein
MTMVSTSVVVLVACLVCLTILYHLFGIFSGEEYSEATHGLLSVFQLMA